MAGNDVIDMQPGEPRLPERAFGRSVFVHRVPRRGVNQQETLPAEREHARRWQIGEEPPLFGRQARDGKRSRDRREVAEAAETLDLDVLRDAVIVVAARR